MTLSLAGTGIRLSSPWVTNIALKYARKRLKPFAEYVNAKVDVPGLTEEQEEALLEASLGLGLDAVAAALRGENVLQAISRRDLAQQALWFVRDNIQDFLGADHDVPLVPEWMEEQAAGAIVELIDKRVLPWVENSPALR
jgi:hypothetical protein